MSYKAKALLQWMLIIPIAFQFLYLGFLKLNGDMASAFYVWGYTEPFMYLVGMTEVLSAAGLFFQKSRIASVITQFIIMFGAIYTHWAFFQYFEILINIGVIGLCTIILWLEREKIMVPEESKRSSLPY